MKKTFLARRAPTTSGITAWLLFSCALAGAAFSMNTGAKASVNLISNPGFETTIAPWAYDASSHGSEGDAATRDPENPRSGQYSLRAGAGHVAYPGLALRAGMGLELRFWARGAVTGAPVTILLRQSGPDDRVLLRMEMNFTGEWREYVFRTSLPDNLAPNAQIYLGFWLHAPGRYWLDDVSLAELPAAEGGEMPALNPIRNHSFEAGADGWTAAIRTPEFGDGWSANETGNGYPTAPDTRLESVAAPNAPHGARHLSIEVKTGNWGWLTSAYFPARHGHAATLTFWARCNTARDITAGVAGGKNNNIILQSQALSLSTVWQQYTVPLTPKPSAGGVYVVRLQLGVGKYDFDDFEFFEDALPPENRVPHPPAHAIQMTAPGAHAGNLFAPGETVSFKLIAAGETHGQALSFQIAAVDFLGRAIEEKNVSLSTDANGLGEAAFNMQTATLGAFRIEARRAEAQAVLAEQLYSVLPEITAPGNRPDSFFGAHIDLTPYNLEIARRGGFRWLRLYPPMTTKWMAVEPAPGQWRFNTSELVAARALGFRILGSFDTAPDWAADIAPQDPGGNRWNSSYPPADMAAWKTYVTRAFTEFHSCVDAWELWNEPDGGYLKVKPGMQKDAVILSLLDATREALDATEQPFTLIGPAVAEINASLGWNILDQGAGAKLDAFSFHFYNMSAGGAIADSEQLLALLEKYRGHTNRFGQTLPLWHTEGGPYLSGGQSWLATTRVPASSTMTPPQAAASLVRTALFFKASGVRRHFLYVVAANQNGRDMQSDGTSACIDMTGIPGPGLAAHAAMVALTEDAAPAPVNAFETTTIGESTLTTIHFTKADGDVDVYWSTKPVALPAVAALRAGDVVRDMMGNTVSAIAAMTGEFPLYVLRATGSAVNLPPVTAVSEGGSVTLNAPAAGIPAPVIRWEYFDGSTWRTVDDDAPFTHQITNNGATLTLTNAGAALNGLRFRYVATIGTLPPATGNEAAIFVSRPYKPAARALALDDDGAIYIANTAQNTIDVIDNNGLATILAGAPNGSAGWLDATGTAARFNQPGGLAVRSGTAYVADTGNNVIRAIALATGDVTTIAGNATAPAADSPADGAGATARLKSPAGLAIDTGGLLFVADSKSHTVRAITPDGTVTTIAGRRGEAGAGIDRLDTPLDVSWGADSALYVADTGNNAIRKLTPGAQPGSGFRMTQISGPGLDAPGGVAWMNGIVYVADTGNSVIRAIASGSMRTIAGREKTPGDADGTPGANVRFNAPSDLVAGPDDEIYVLDTGNKAVRIITDALVGSTQTPALATIPIASSTQSPKPPEDGGSKGGSGGGGGATSLWHLLALAALAFVAKRKRG